jgi:hypothetical protein
MIDLGNEISCQAIVDRASVSDFHFDLFVELIPIFHHPNSILNTFINSFYKQLYLRCKVKDIDLLDKLVQVGSSLSKAMLRHPLERIELTHHYHVVSRMIYHCVNSKALDNQKIVQRILCTLNSYLPK